MSGSNAKKKHWSIEHSNLSTRLTSPAGDYVWLLLGNGKIGMGKLVKALAKDLGLKGRNP